MNLKSKLYFIIGICLFECAWLASLYISSVFASYVALLVLNFAGLNVCFRIGRTGKLNCK